LRLLRRLSCLLGRNSSLSWESLLRLLLETLLRLLLESLLRLLLESLLRLLLESLLRLLLKSLLLLWYSTLLWLTLGQEAADLVISESLTSELVNKSLLLVLTTGKTNNEQDSKGTP